MPCRTLRSAVLDSARRLEITRPHAASETLGLCRPCAPETPARQGDLPERRHNPEVGTIGDTERFRQLTSSSLRLTGPGWSGQVGERYRLFGVHDPAPRRPFDGLCSTVPRSMPKQSCQPSRTVSHTLSSTDPGDPDLLSPATPRRHAHPRSNPKSRQRGHHQSDRTT